MQAIETTFGGLDVLFANAGVMMRLQPLGREDEAHVLRCLGVTLQPTGWRDHPCGVPTANVRR